ncbi:MAG: hypothetical protein AMXMBFR48_19400 [Ignavibacteriales bacterium]
MRYNSSESSYDFDSVHWAGFWIRVLARMIDGLILTVVMLIIWLLIYLSFDAQFSNFWDVYYFLLDIDQWTAAIVLYMLFYMIIYFCYFVVLNIKFGQTIGKIMTNIQIRDYDNLGEITIGKAIGRFFALELFSFIPFVNILNFAWAGFDPQKQTWHDKLGRTVVVYKDSLREQIRETVPEPSRRFDDTPRRPSMNGREFGELIFTRGLMNSKHFTLRGKNVLIGRKEELVHVYVEDPEKRISRVQCEIFEIDGRYKLRNRASVATTMLNGKPVKEDILLRSDDRIGFGSHEAKIVFF